jgi:hypothetical protein
LGEKNFLNFKNNRLLILTIFMGATIVGFTTGNVVAQEVRLGSNEGTPTVSFEDALASGMYEIRLNDGTGQFQIYDITNNRNALIVASNGNIAVGDSGTPVQDFTIGCSTGECNIQSRAFNGNAQNTVKALGPTGDARFRLWDNVSPQGSILFDITTKEDGTVCMGQTNQPCMLIFDIKGPNPGQVKQTDGTCIANC